MPVGKKEIKGLQKSTKKPTRCELVGFSIPFLKGGLSLRLVAIYSLSVQPFADKSNKFSCYSADKIGDYTCRNRKRKRNKKLQSRPSFPCRYRSGNVSIISFFHSILNIIVMDTVRTKGYQRS